MPFALKPAAGSSINYGHPHANGLILCVPFLGGAGGPPDSNAASPGSLHDYGPLNRHGSPVVTPGPFYPGWTTTPAGLAVRVGGPASGEKLDFGNSSLIIPLSGGFTWVMGYQKFDTTARATQMGVIDAAPQTKRCQLSLPWSDGNIYWDWGGITVGTSRLSVAMPTPVNTYAVWAFTTGDRGMEIWKDGKLLASNSGNATRVTVSTSFYLGGSSSSDSDKSDFTFCYLYKRQLDQSTIQSLVVDPYAMLRVPRGRRYIAQLWPAPVSSVTFGGPSIAGTGTETFTGTGAESFAGPALAGTNFTVITGTASAAFGAPALAGTGTETFTGTGAVGIGVSSVRGGNVPPRHLGDETDGTALRLM